MSGSPHRPWLSEEVARL